MSVSSTILQESVSVVIGGKTYQVAPPSIATLILCSESIASLPFTNQWDGNNLAIDVLQGAKDCRALGKVMATLILGARAIDVRPNLWQFWRCGGKRRLDLLARKILNETTPQEISTAFAQILQTMQIGDFFGFTTSLIEINITKPTRGVEKTSEIKATASGRQWRGSSSNTDAPLSMPSMNAPTST